ncbi:MAG: hypothetical protein IJI10_10325 [Eubacterium sp.]|nr:hypothetical protein [Eubacterium sp.]
MKNESGSRGQNRVEILDRIARHYRITLDELLHNDYSALRKTIESIGRKISDPENQLLSDLSPVSRCSDS